MKTKLQIEQEIESTFKALDTIEEVKVNHFFKHKVLQKLNAEKEVKQTIFSWFTPQLQLATLSIVLLLNASVIFYTFSSSEVTIKSNLETFAQDYNLNSNSDSILN